MAQTFEEWNESTANDHLNVIPDAAIWNYAKDAWNAALAQAQADGAAAVEAALREAAEIASRVSFGMPARDEILALIPSGNALEAAIRQARSHE